jgi:hypothetical protein
MTELDELRALRSRLTDLVDRGESDAAAGLPQAASAYERAERKRLLGQIDADLRRLEGTGTPSFEIATRLDDQASPMGTTEASGGPTRR